MQVTRRKHCQTRTRPRKKACVYGVRVSGPTIYAYVKGNPLNVTDSKGLMGGGGNHARRPLPSVNDPCVQQYVHDHYGDLGGFITEIGNLQQFFPSANSDYLTNVKEGLVIADEKILLTKVPVALGQAMMNAIPGNLAIGHVTGRGIAWLGGLSSGVVEVAGAFMTPFATTAMAMARDACACNKK